ncbi:hydroxyethylthiazole kinase [Methanothrix sp.]|uniref:hydroxyethylthiazole kinase n=1 Tax=Methanothrix sp. TaxID=90426 RepID=UPI003BB7ED9B
MILDAAEVLERVRRDKPLVHHLTNFVTIYDCANIVKVFGASPVMAHAREEVADMAKIASSLVLNIGTLTTEFVEAMLLAGISANEKKIPVVLDVCGAGATRFRDDKCQEILDAVEVSIIKGNSSEVARIAGEDVLTRGVDAADIEANLLGVAHSLARERGCTVVITGKDDIVADMKRAVWVHNGHPMMANVVGTGCMATSVIGAFAAVETDQVVASVSGLICYEVAAEIAALVEAGPGSFKENLYDAVYNLDSETIRRMQKIELEEKIALHNMAD